MIRVHQNLHKSTAAQAVFSVRRGNNPIEHTSSITLANVAFHVGASGLAKVRAARRRMVFAWVKGDEIPCEPLPANAERVSFNPFKEGKFVWASDRLPCGNLTKIHFTPQGAYAIR